LLPQHPQVNDTLGKAIMDLDAQAVSAVKNMPPMTPGADLSSTARADQSVFPLAVMGEEIRVDFPLAGRHQLRNLALAITTAEQLNQCGFNISPFNVERGITMTRWPARFQVIPGEDGFPEVVLDVAHNPAGAWALRSALSAFYEDRPLTFIFGAMGDKAIGEIADILFPLAERVIATQADNPRAASPGQIADLAAHSQTQILQVSSVRAAMDRARVLAGSRGVIVITGSIYIVGEALGVLAHSSVRQSV
jgi:dihydrofolate synthase/folylpolyglutamate synthase